MPLKNISQLEFLLFSIRLCSDAADKAAGTGADLYACPGNLLALVANHSKHMCEVGILYTEIAVARNDVAKKNKLLTYKPTGKPDESETSQAGFSRYFVHSDDTQPCFPPFKEFPPYTRSLRFRFGELAWQAMCWYMQQLRWPQDYESLGITWAELCLDFELSTGVTLPRGASLCSEKFGSRLLGRQATLTSDQNASRNLGRLEHSLENVFQNKKVRFRCMVCSRTGA